MNMIDRNILLKIMSLLHLERYHTIKERFKFELVV